MVIVIKSMTGFGRGEYSTEDRKMSLEMKSVNHRYCDINIRMPKKISFLENNIRNTVKGVLSRGKIDIFINYEDNSEGNECVIFNEDIAKQYLKCFEEMGNDFKLENDIKVSHLSRYPEVLKLEEQEADEEVLWDLLKSALDIALNKMVETRTTEGELLKKDIVSKLTNMSNHLELIKTRAPLIVEEYRIKLENRLNELLNNTTVDESRLAMEIAMFADKSCVDEEIVRLGSHIQHMEKTIEKKGPIGRKLDFLAQEMNREANTILSKANDIDVSNYALELKTEIEKIREQIQNIE